MSYLGYAVLLGALLLAFVLSSVLVIMGTEKLIGGDLVATRDLYATRMLVAKYLGIPFVISLVILVATLFIAGLNITAKRALDIGLPGWVFVVGCVIATLLVFKVFSLELSLILSALIFTGLLLFPGNAIKGQ